MHCRMADALFALVMACNELDYSTCQWGTYAGVLVQGIMLINMLCLTELGRGSTVIDSSS